MRPVIVAEIGASHLGSPERALRILEESIWAGADMVKGQCWEPELMVGGPRTIKSGPWAGKDMHELYREAHMPKAWHMLLRERARALGADYFATAFDLPSLYFLEDLGMRRHKIASFEIVDLELVAAAARCGKPLILSTGMAKFSEIECAVRAARSAKLETMPSLTLLRCVSAYPAPADEAGLGSLRFISDYFGCQVGLSDHSLGTAVAVTATALGARMIEKHVTLHRADGGPDAAFSIEPHELSKLVHDCKTAAMACGEAAFTPSLSEAPQLALRRSLWWATDLIGGHVIKRDHIRSARPAEGLPCSQLPNVIGAVTSRSVHAGTPIERADLAP